MTDIINKITIKPEVLSVWRHTRQQAIDQVKAAGVELKQGFAEVHELWDGGLMITAPLNENASVGMTVAPHEWCWNGQQN